MSQAKLSPPRRALQNARAAAQGLENCTSEDLYERHWSEFVTWLEGVWNKAAGHYKIHSSWQGWLTPYCVQRRDDPLLMYLQQARNSVIHRVETLVEGTPQDMLLQVVTPEGMAIVESLRAEGKTVEHHGGNRFKFVQGSVRWDLHPVRNKDQVYQVPTEHLGVPLPYGGPGPIIRSGLSYYERFLQSAESYFGR